MSKLMIQWKPNNSPMENLQSKDVEDLKIPTALEMSSEPESLTAEQPSAAALGDYDFEDDFEIISEHSFSDEGDLFAFCAPFTPTSNKNISSLNFQEDTNSRYVERLDPAAYVLEYMRLTMGTDELDSRGGSFSDQDETSECALSLRRSSLQESFLLGLQPSGQSADGNPADDPKIGTRTSDHPSSSISHYSPSSLYVHCSPRCTLKAKSDGIELNLGIVGQQSASPLRNAYPETSLDELDILDETIWSDLFHRLSNQYRKLKVLIPSQSAQTFETLKARYPITSSVRSSVLRIILVLEIFTLGFLVAHTAHNSGWIGCGPCVERSRVPEASSQNTDKGKNLDSQYALKFKRQEMVSKVWRDKFEELIAENAALQVQLIALQHQLTSDLSFARENINELQEATSSMKSILQGVNEMNEVRNHEDEQPFEVGHSIQNYF